MLSEDLVDDDSGVFDLLLQFLLIFRQKGLINEFKLLLKRLLLVHVVKSNKLLQQFFERPIKFVNSLVISNTGFFATFALILCELQELWRVISISRALLYNTFIFFLLRYIMVIILERRCMMIAIRFTNHVSILIRLL